MSTPSHCADPQALTKELPEVKLPCISITDARPRNCGTRFAQSTRGATLRTCRALARRLALATAMSATVPARGNRRREEVVSGERRFLDTHQRMAERWNVSALAPRKGVRQYATPALDLAIHVYSYRECICLSYPVPADRIYTIIDDFGAVCFAFRPVKAHQVVTNAR